MSIFADRYDYLTRKQANIVYRAAKEGRLSLSASFVNAMYTAVEDRSRESYQTMCRCQLLVSLILDDEYELAQKVADGSWAERKPVEVGRRTPQLEELEAMLWFEDDVETAREGILASGVPLYEERWVEKSQRP